MTKLYLHISYLPLMETFNHHPPIETEADGHTLFMSQKYVFFILYETVMNMEL